MPHRTNAKWRFAFVHAPGLGPRGGHRPIAAGSAHARTVPLTHSLTHTRWALAALAAASVAVGQVNVTSDVVTFRDSGKKDKTATHYGMLNIAGLSGGGGKALHAVNETTASYYGIGTYGIYAQCNYSSDGTGFRGDGLKRGLYGISTLGGTSVPHYGGEFSAGNSSALNYGVYATTQGSSGTRYAGYFDGNVYCTGSYQGSDAVLKQDAQPLQGAVQTLTRLRPQTYFFDTLT